MVCSNTVKPKYFPQRKIKHERLPLVGKWRLPSVHALLFFHPQRELVIDRWQFEGMYLAPIRFIFSKKLGNLWHHCWHREQPRNHKDPYGASRIQGATESQKCCIWLRNSESDTLHKLLLLTGLVSHLARHHEGNGKVLNYISNDYQKCRAGKSKQLVHYIIKWAVYYWCPDV